MKIGRFLAPLLALTLVIGAFGHFVFERLRADIRDETERTLTVIAEQKRQQIETWLAQARGDAALYFSGSSQIRMLFEQWLSGARQDQALPDRMQTRLVDLAAARGWGGYAVIDAQGRPLFAAGEASVEVHADRIQAFLHHPRAVVSELHRGSDGRIVFCVMTPIGDLDGPPLGMALVTWDADRTLFPLVGSWPTPTRSAETFLVQRDGDLVRALTPLRFLPDAPLALTQPLAQPDLLVSRVVRGQRGLISDADDYRGQAVLAYATPVTDTPWLMVAKIDQREIDEGLRATLWLTGLSTGLGLVVVYVAGFALWNRDRQRQALAQARAREAAERGFHAERRELEERLHAITETAHDAILMMDPRGAIAYWNPAATAILGYTAEAALGRNLHELLAPERYLGGYHAAFPEFLKTGRGAAVGKTIEVSARHRDGTERTVEMSLSTVALKDGWNAIGIMRDITGRKHMEQQLRLSEARHRLLADNALDVIWIMDLGGRTTYVSPAVERVFGYTQAEAMAMPSPDGTPAPAETSVCRLLRETVTGLQSGDTMQPFRGELTERRRDGTTIVTETTVTAIYDESGRFVEVVGVSRDITARVQAEQRMQETLRLLQVATRAADIGIWNWEFATGRLNWDERLCAWYEVPEEARQAGFYYDFWKHRVHPDDRERAEADLAECVREGRPYEDVFRILLPDGRVRHIHTLAVIERDSNDRPWRLVGVNRDITAQHEHEEALRAAKSTAEAATQAKSAFLAHMSHDIRTPLNGVLGLTQVLEQTALDAEQRTMVRQVRLAGYSLLGLINDILDLSKVEANQLEIDRRAFSLATLMAETESVLKPTAHAKGLRLEIEPPPDLHGALLGDPLRLGQVLSNLIGNAIKFSDQGGVYVRAETVAVSARSVRLRFTVRDTGIGMAPETLARLFKPFTQADSSITRRFGGSGLGLSICKHLVELMGGEIGTESVLGEGSTFWFELPFEVAPASSRRESAAHRLDASTSDRLEAGPTGPRLAGVRVLVVDDSAMNQEVAQRMLALEGAQIALAADGREGLERLRAAPHGFDAVLMDVQMPVMDGLTATRLARQEPALSGLPIIALTAGVMAEEQDAARAAGVNEVLHKPLDMTQMVTVLLRWTSPQRAAVPAHTPRPAAAPDAPAPEAFPDIPGIDRERAALALGGNRALFIDLLQKFANHSAEAGTDVRRALAAGEPATAARRMHTLRGDIGYLGALDLMSTAEAVERAIRQGEDGSALEARLVTLDAQVTALIAASRVWLAAAHATVTSASTEPQPPAPLTAERLAALHEALRDNDLEALSIWNALAPALQGVLGQTATETLASQLRSLQFSAALAILEEGAAMVTDQAQTEPR